MVKRPSGLSIVSYVQARIILHLRLVKIMLRAIFTVDYEIHGNGEGCPYSLMVEPTRRILDLFDQYGAKLTIMAEVAEILKFKEYKEKHGSDDFHYEAIVNQLKEAVKGGHDVQLHIHPSYVNAKYQDGCWIQDWDEYNFAGLPFERLDELTSLGKNFLEELLKPVKSTYECVAFRAANWAVSPSRDVVRALVKNGIRIETSVFKYGRRDGIVSFDYSNIPSNLVPWPADESNICQKNNASQLIEVPIYAEKRWIGAFLSKNRIHGARMTRKHPIKNINDGKRASGQPKADWAKRILTKIALPFQLHSWKADFNKCTGHQLIQALERADAEHGGMSVDLPFVLIGHSKLFSQQNEDSLKPFLAYIVVNSKRFGFGTFGNMDFQLSDSSHVSQSQ
jgi:hypothetical protein